MTIRLFPALLIAVATSALFGCASVPNNELKLIAVAGAPKAAGPYSQGVVANGLLFTAATVPRDPVTNSYVQGDMAVQAQRVLDNLEAIVTGAGASLKDVVKATVYMVDLAEFSKVNDVMAARFGEHKPARSTIQVAKIPGGAPLAIDLIARVPQ
jgi:2-iminobutanoate/2-iminopropanoate deaminase